jgi:hypothetical protein
LQPRQGLDEAGADQIGARAQDLPELDERRAQALQEPREHLSAQVLDALAV